MRKIISYIILAAFFFTSTLFLLYLNLNINRFVTPTPVTITQQTGITPTITTIPTADWKIYEDKTVGISFNHPSKFTIELQPRDDGSGVNYLFAPDYVISLSVLKKYSDIAAKYFMNTTSDGEMKIGDNLWKTYFVPKGYPEGTVGAGKPIYALQIEINKNLVTLVLYNQSNITDEQFQILSTFKFIP